MQNEVLERIKDETSLLHETERRKAKRIRHILYRNCPLKHVFEGKIQGTEDEEGEVSIYWVPLRKSDTNGN